MRGFPIDAVQLSEEVRLRMVTRVRRLGLEASLAAFICLLVVSPARWSWAQAESWKPFKLGFTEASTVMSQIRIEDIKFEISSGVLPATMFGAKRLVATFNVKNLANQNQGISVSIALFNKAKELLCADMVESGGFSGLKPKEARSLRIDFGECGAAHTSAGKVSLFQVTVYARSVK